MFVFWFSSVLTGYFGGLVAKGRTQAEEVKKVDCDDDGKRTWQVSREVAAIQATREEERRGTREREREGD